MLERVLKTSKPRTVCGGGVVMGFNAAQKFPLPSNYPIFTIPPIVNTAGLEGVEILKKQTIRRGDEGKKKFKVHSLVRFYVKECHVHVVRSHTTQALFPLLFEGAFHSPPHPMLTPVSLLSFFAIARERKERRDSRTPQLTAATQARPSPPPPLHQSPQPAAAQALPPSAPPPCVSAQCCSGAPCSNHPDFRTLSRLCFQK